MTEELPEEEIILADLSDEDLVVQMHDDLYDGLGEEIVEGTTILLLSLIHISEPTRPY